MTGTVRSLQVEKRFGFIKTSTGRDDYFFHKDDLQGDWDDLVMEYQRGQVTVEFEPVNSPKGPRASNVVMS